MAGEPVVYLHPEFIVKDMQNGAWSKAAYFRLLHLVMRKNSTLTDRISDVPKKLDR